MTVTTGAPGQSFKGLGVMRPATPSLAVMPPPAAPGHRVRRAGRRGVGLGCSPPGAGRKGGVRRLCVHSVSRFLNGTTVTALSCRWPQLGPAVFQGTLLLLSSGDGSFRAECVFMCPGVTDCSQAGDRVKEDVSRPFLKGSCGVSS